ncbi:MAG: hypothetical protein KJ077_10380 [Anaerolineae bacterium]|nr:hypothetical protein [Anaerolineae bacterium]
MTFLVSTEQQTRLRSPHKARLYLSVYQPATVYTAQVNQPGITNGTRVVTYNNATGNLADVLPLFTVWIGTAPGLHDLGKVRLRAISGTQITVAENAIPWQNAAYITILREVGIWSVWPRFDDDIFYKDYDVTYTNQNRLLDPVVIAGPDRAGFLSAGSLALPVDLSASYCPGSTISSFSAAAYPSTGVSISLNSGTGIGTITLTTAGSRLIEFSATAANGKTYKTYRVYIAHNRSGANAPITRFRLASPITGRVDQPGFSTRIEVGGSATLADFPDNATILIWKEDEYADSSDPVALDPYGSILFSGFIRNDQFIHGDPKNNPLTTFQATTIGHLLSRHRMFSISLNAAGNPKKWYEFKSNLLTPGAAIYHLIKEHSTAMRRSDWIGLATDAIYLKAVDFLEATLFSQASGLALNQSILAQFSGDNKGRMYFQRNPQYLDASEKNALSEVMEIEREDVDGSATIVRQPELSTSMTHLSGFYYNPNSAQSTPLISKAPGDAPEWAGEGIVNVERQALINQTRSNQLVGRVHAYHNAEYREFRLNMIGDYSGVFATMPRRWYRMTVNGNFNNRQITLSNARFLCQEVSLNYDSAKGDVTTSVILEREVIAVDGVTGDYPTSIPSPSSPPISWPTEINPLPDTYDITLPPTEIPPEAESSFPPLAAWGSCLLLEDLVAGWQDASGGIAGADVHGTTRPAWKQDAATANPENAKMYRLNANKVYVTTNGGQNWREMGPRLDPPNSWDDDPVPTLAELTAVQVYCSKYGTVYVLYRWENPSNLWRGWVARTMDNGESDWEWLGLDHGLALGNLNFEFNTDLEGWALDAQAAMDIFGASTEGQLYHSAFGEPGMQESGGPGANYVGIKSPPLNVGITASTVLSTSYVTSVAGFGWIAVFSDGSKELFDYYPENAGSYSPTWSFAPWAGRTLAYIELANGSHGSSQAVFYRYIRFSDVNTTLDANIDTYPLWFDVSEDDLTLTVTAQRGGVLAALIYILNQVPAEVPEEPALGEETARLLPATGPVETNLGTCTVEEAVAGTWRAYPAFWPHLSDFVVYGLLNAPPGLTGNCQIVEVLGGELAPDAIVGGEDGWGSDVCGSLKFYNPLGGARSYIYAIRNTAAGSTVAFSFASDAQGWLNGPFVPVNGLDDPGMAAASYDGTDGSPDPGCLKCEVAASTGEFIVGKKLTYTAMPGDNFSFKYKLTITGTVEVYLQDMVTETIIGPLTANVDWTEASYPVPEGSELTNIAFIYHDTVGTGSFILQIDEVKISGSSGCEIYLDPGTPKKMLSYKPVPVGSVAPDGMAINQKGLVAIGDAAAAVVVKGWPGGNWTDISDGLTSVDGIRSLRWL